jgi:hypothetical protein
MWPFKRRKRVCDVKFIGVVVVLLLAAGGVIWWKSRAQHVEVTKQPIQTALKNVAGSEQKSAAEKNVSALENRVSALEKTVKFLTLSDEEQKQMTHYYDDNLRIAFEYPSYWGEVTMGNIVRDMPTAKFVQFTTLGWVGVADYPNTTERARGGFYGDWAREIKKEPSCPTKTNKCPVFKNKYGVVIEKQTGCFQEGCDENSPYKETVYSLYNPYSKWTGLIFSDRDLVGTNILPDINNQYDRFVQSIDFIDSDSIFALQFNYPRHSLEKKGNGYLIFSSTEARQFDASVKLVKVDTKLIVGTRAAIIADAKKISAGLTGRQLVEFDEFVKSMDGMPSVAMEGFVNLLLVDGEKDAQYLGDEDLEYIRQQLRGE